MQRSSHRHSYKVLGLLLCVGILFLLAWGWLTQKTADWNRRAEAILLLERLDAQMRFNSDDELEDLGLYAGGTIWLERAGGATRSLLQAAAVALPILLAFLSWQQSHIYLDQETLWDDTLRKNPDAWLAHYNLGILLRDRGELDEAARHFREVLRIRPEDAWAHHELGRVRQSQGRFPEALAHYQQALANDPLLAETHYNLGTLAQRLGNQEQAVHHYEEAIAIKPEYAEAHNNLGTALQILGQTSPAIAHYRQALRLAPANAHYNLGKLLLQQGHREAGETHLEEFQRLNRQLKSQRQEE